MKSALAIFTLLSLALCACAQTPCFARITATPRASSDASWTIGDTQYQIYDITAMNEGTCALSRVVGFFSARDGTITEAWNYEIDSGLISGYGDELQVGATFSGAGFVTANSSGVTLALDRPGCDDSCYASSTPSPSSPTTPADGSPSPSPSPSPCTVTLEQTVSQDEEDPALFLHNIIITNTGTSDVITPVFFIVLVEGMNLGLVSTSGLVTYATTVPYQTLVSLPPNTIIAPGTTYTAASYVTNNTVTALRLSSCISDDDDTTSAPPTSTPTLTPTTSASPTTSDDAPTTSTTGGCAVTPTITRDGYSWTDSEGRNASVYRITITNAGPCALKDYATSFSLFPGVLLSSWNLEGTRGGYFVRGYGDTLAAGASYNGAGFILAGAPDTVVATPYGSNCAC